MIEMTTEKLTIKAIKSIAPNTSWVLRGDKLEWLDETQSQPTEAEIQAEVERLQAEYDANQYQRDRAAEYPAIEDQLDMIYHAGQGGDEFQAAIQAVKDKYPKE